MYEPELKGLVNGDGYQLMDDANEVNDLINDIHAEWPKHKDNNHVKVKIVTEEHVKSNACNFGLKERYYMGWMNRLTRM